MLHLRPDTSIRDPVDRLLRTAHASTNLALRTKKSPAAWRSAPSYDSKFRALIAFSLSAGALAKSDRRMRRFRIIVPEMAWPRPPAYSRACPATAASALTIRRLHCGWRWGCLLCAARFPSCVFLGRLTARLSRRASRAGLADGTLLLTLRFPFRLLCSHWHVKRLLYGFRAVRIAPPKTSTI
jgi:hypothetical protein